MRFLFLLFFVSLSLTPKAFAVNSSDGCGVANQVWADQSWVAITVRSTIRSSYSGTLDWTGTTSGKFGCSKHSIVKKDKKSLHFLEANNDQLILEMAQGDGEYLLGFARSLGCQDNVYGEFSQELQKNFNTIFNNTDKKSVESLDVIKNIIKRNQTLKSNCTAA